MLLIKLPMVRMQGKHIRMQVEYIRVLQMAIQDS
jgi:hypothetical protein